MTSNILNDLADTFNLCMTSNIQEFLKNPIDAPRHKARVLVNRAVKDLSGGAVCLSDLADTFNLCAGLDELEELIDEADEFTPMQDLLDVAQDIAAQLLEEEGFPA
jgi:hypothetical protein